jgi:DNA-binding MarR family transcriptional regulator
MSQASLGLNDWHAQSTGAHKSPSHFGYLVHDLARVRGALFDRLFKPIGLTRTQVVLLGTLVNCRYILNQQELSVAMDLSKVTIGAMIDVLEREGFVKRGIGKTDRREKLIRVTPQGLAALERARAIGQEADKEILADLSEESIRITEKILGHINTIIREMTEKAKLL